MTWLRTVWIVARWEFTTTVMRPAFLAVMVGLPIVHIGIAGLIGLSIGDATTESKVRRPIAVVDEAGVLADVPGDDRIVRDKAAAIQALASNGLDAVVVLSPDYLGTGRAEIYDRPVTSLLHIGRGIEHRERAAALIRRALSVREAAADARVTRIVEPLVEVSSWRVDGATMTRRFGPPFLEVFAGPFGVCFIMALSIFLASGLLQQAMSTELQNRMLEVMLSIMTPARLLAGKVAGLAAAGLLEAIVYLVLTVGGAPLIGGVAIAWDVAAWCAVIFLAGYLLFAVLMAGTGALARDPQEVPQLASLWMLLAAAPFFFMAQISADGASLTARALTWFPPTAPVALLLRMSTGSVEVLERLGSLALVVGFAAVGWWVSAFLFAARVRSGGQLQLGGLSWK
jgi:ABC-2 type transport system permease protein